MPHKAIDRSKGLPISFTEHLEARAPTTQVLDTSAGRLTATLSMRRLDMLGFGQLALEILVAVIVAAWVLGITYFTLRSFEKYSGSFVVFRSRRRSSALGLGRRLPPRVRPGSQVRDRHGVGVVTHRAR